MAMQQPTRRDTQKAKPGSSPASASIPDKLYFRIGEVARLCALPAYVLRFWETEFPQLKPNKGGTGQRLYRKRDVELAIEIKSLLYDQKFTIPGARHILQQKRRSDAEPQSDLPFRSPQSQAPAARLHKLRGELQEILGMLDGTLPKQKSASQHNALSPVRRSFPKANARRASADADSGTPLLF